LTKEEEILQNLSDAVLNFDSDAAIDAAKASVEAKISPVKAIEEGLAKGLRVVGDRFEAGELWLPHLVLGAEALEAAVKVLEEHMAIEDLGLRIVASMLRANSFRVYDIGCDAHTLNFIEKAKEVKADIIAASSLMTTTMPFMKDLIEALETAGIRDQYKVMVGGGPVTEEWAKAIGADGYGKDAAEAVRVAKELVKR
jgi:methanogenic corrinoid protein MtbC1